MYSSTQGTPSPNVFYYFEVLLYLAVFSEEYLEIVEVIWISLVGDFLSFIFSTKCKHRLALSSNQTDHDVWSKLCANDPDD